MLGPNLDTPSNGDRAVEQDQSLLKEAIQAIEREITMDRLVPSFHNVVTQAGLQVSLAPRVKAVFADPVPYRRN